MVITVLEASVDKKYWQLLKSTYENMTMKVPPAIKASYLIQNQNAKSIWRIITVWESQAVLDAMLESGETPTGIVIFQKANAKPNLEIYDVQKSVISQRIH